MDIKKRVKKIPETPGVYLFLGYDGEVLYIGKAANLRKRVTSYFHNNYHLPKTRMLVSQIKDFEYIITSTSAEALIYEARLIKEKNPKYNIELKDDKSYPFLKFTVKEKFPRLFITREKIKDGSIYYGPYTNVGLLKKALSMIRAMFLLRACKTLPKSACLKAQIKKCAAPCDGSINEKEYRKIVAEVKYFLEGKKKDLIRHLRDRMSASAKRMDYENAVISRDKIDALGAMWMGRIPPPPLNREISSLKSVLGLKVLPTCIEAFDISNTQGKEAVGSVISFFSGRPQKDEYRRFRIKTVMDINDYAMLREVIRRRYARILAEKKKMPNLIVIDGGRGHLGVARDELNKQGLFTVPIIGIAKEAERVYTENSSRPLMLTTRDPALKLIMKLRDEAHRFAISYHKFLRRKRVLGRDKKYKK